MFTISKSRPTTVERALIFYLNVLLSARLKCRNRTRTVFATANVKRIKLKDKRKRGDCESTIYAFVKKNAQTSRVRYNRYLSSGANRDRTGDLRLAKPLRRRQARVCKRLKYRELRVFCPLLSCLLKVEKTSFLKLFRPNFDPKGPRVRRRVETANGRRRRVNVKRRRSTARRFLSRVPSTACG